MTRFIDSKGKILSLENSNIIINNSKLVIGCLIKNKKIIIIESKKDKINNLINDFRTYKLHKNLIIGVTGLLGDCLFVMEQVKKICREYEREFNSLIPESFLIQKISLLLHELARFKDITLACSIIILSTNSVYEINPIGTIEQKDYCGAIGKNATICKVLNVSFTSFSEFITQVKNTFENFEDFIISIN